MCKSFDPKFRSCKIFDKSQVCPQNGDAINHLGTREDQAFFCFTKIIATWIGGWGLGDLMHGGDEDGHVDHDNFQVGLYHYVEDED